MISGLPDEAKRSFDAAMEIIRTIDTDAKKSAKREQEWLKRLPENSFPDFESDTEWKPEALLRAVKALAFVGQVDEALGFEEEYVRSEKDAFDFAAKGLAKQTLIGPSVQEDRKERYEQAKSVFRLEIVSSMIQSDTKY